MSFTNCYAHSLLNQYVKVWWLKEHTAFQHLNEIKYSDSWK